MIPPDFVSVRQVYSQLEESLGSDGYGKLEYLLTTGQLVAYSIDDAQGNYTPLGRGYWANMGHSTRRQIFEMDPKESQTKGIPLAEIFVRKVDLTQVPDLKPPLSTAELYDLKRAIPGTASGRPVDFDWDAIWAGIVWIVHNQGLPKTQAAMIKQVQEWYEATIEKDSAPSRTALQPRIKKLFDRMNKPE